MGYRKIDVNGQEWKWKVGSTFLDIRDPTGKGYRPKKADIGEIVLKDPDDPAPGSATMITTGHVRRYIEGIRQ